MRILSNNKFKFVTELNEKPYVPALLKTENRYKWEVKDFENENSNKLTAEDFEKPSLNKTFKFVTELNSNPKPIKDMSPLLPPLLNTRKQLNSKSVSEGIDLTPINLPVNKDNGFWANIRNNTDKITSNPIFKAITAIPNKLYDIPFTQRLITKAGESIAGEGAYKNADGTVLKPMDTGSKLGNLAGDIIGAGLGFAMPMSGIGQGGKIGNLQNVSDEALKPLLNKLPQVSNKLGQYGVNALKTGLDFGTLNTIQGLSQGKSVGDSLEAGKEGVLQGAAFGTGIKALGNGLTALKKIELPKFNDLKVNVFDTKFKNELVPNIETPTFKPSLNGSFKVKNTQYENVVNKYNEAIETIQNHFKTDKLTAEEVARIKPELGIDFDNIVKDMEKYSAGPKLNEITDKAIYQYAAGLKEAPTKLQVPNLIKPEVKAPVIKPIEPPFIKPLEVAKGEAAATKIIASDLNPRSFSQTIAKGEITSPELKRLIEKTDINYKPITNKDTLDFANKAIENNYDEALSLVKSNGPATAESNTISQLLIKKLQDEGNYTEALEIIEKVSAKATSQGQAIQALSMWGRLTPEGMLKFAQKTIDNANTKLPEPKKLKLTEEAAKDITEKMKQIAGMEEGRAKTVATAEVLKKVSDQVPPSLLGKISNFQTVAQLLNGKTAIRNILGNAGFNILENAKDLIATPLDIGLSKLTGQRTTALPSLKTQGKGFLNGLKLGYEDAVKGIDTSGVKTQFDLPQGSMFKSKFGKSIEKLLSVELKAPDRAFYQAAYDDSIRKQMKLSKVVEPSDTMIENAHLDALYKTFQDDNVVSKAFSNTKKALNLYKEFGLGDIALKYPKTPANILMRAIDYSPAGYAKTLIQLAKDINNKSFNQKAFVEGVGRATTGTASLIGTGYILNQLGIITGQSENDYDTKEVEKTVGLGDYKLNVSALKRYIFSGFDKGEAKAQKNDTIADYSFMQPMAIGLVVGADISQNKANPNGSISRLTEAIMTGTDTLVEQPLMQGIKRLSGQGSTSKALMETLKGVPASFVPSILNQVRQLTDNVSRNTYDTSLGKQSLNLVKNKIPGLSKTLEPRIDVLGQEKEVFQNKSNKPLNVLLNPAIVTKYQDKPAAQLPLDIFKASGEKIQMPRLVDNKITYKGTTYPLTPKEITQYQRTVGEKTQKQFEQKKGWLNSLSKPEEKAKELQKLLTKINEETRNKILKDRGIIK